MAYPDSTLRDDTLDALYGGRPALEMGGLAWQWINNVVRVLSEAHLLYNRSAFRTLAPVTSTALAVGDVAVLALAEAGGQGAYVVRKAVAGDEGVATTRVLGVCVVGAGATRRAVLATSGVVPRVVAGFASLTAAQEVSVNYTTGRLQVAGGGDVVVGYGDVQGNVLLDLGL
jgi:hypothetical protein